MKTSEIDVCMDTNVLIEMETMFNASDAFKNRDDKKLSERLQNMRGSLALAWMLHIQKRRVFCLGGETQDILDKNVRAGSPDAIWSWLYRHFMFEFVFDMSKYYLDGSFPERSLRGNERDKMLVAEANRRGVSLITREKTKKGAIARAASKCGVPVMIPEAYVKHCGCCVDKLAGDLLLEIERTFPVFVICEMRNSQPGGAWSPDVFVENCRAYFLQLKTVLTGENEYLVSLASLNC